MAKNLVPQKSVQDKQDEIFRNMSADQKLELWAGFWQLAKDIAIYHERKNRSKVSSTQDSQNS